MPYSLLSTLRRNNPRPALPWRVMAHMLVVTAFELRHPMHFIILVKANDPTLDAFHAGLLRVPGFFAGCIEGDCCTDERLERARFDPLALMDINRSPCVPVEA